MGNGELDFVEVRLALTASDDFHQSGGFERLDEFIDARNAHAHVLGETFLAGKAGIVVPRVAEKHRINDFRSDRQNGIAQNKIRDLGEPATCDRIERVELNVLLLENVPYCLHALHYTTETVDTGCA